MSMENELDETVFIPDEDFQLQKKWIEENVKDIDWREGYGHQKIYNELAFKLGILDKLENTRQRISIESSKEVIKILHILGFGSKKTAYWLWKWGFKGISLQVIQAYVRINRRHWEKEKQEFMNGITEAKNKIFQDAKEDVMQREKRTMGILLRNLDELQDLLEKLHPIDDKAQYNTTLNQIVKLEERCKSYHGLEEFRQSFIKASTDIAIHKGKLEAEREPAKAIDVGNQRPEIME